jgi:transposase InsO family protein
LVSSDGRPRPTIWQASGGGPSPQFTRSAGQPLEWATLTYVDWFNNRRIHNEIGKIPPAEFEENYYRQNATVELVSSQTNESA